MNLGSSVAVRGSWRFGNALSVAAHIHVANYVSVHELIRTQDAVSDGKLVFHYASGGFVGASQVSAGDLQTSMAEVRGSLVAEGGAVFGSTKGPEIKLDGTSGKYRLIYDAPNAPATDPATDPSRITMLAGEEARISYGMNSGTLRGDWGIEGATTFHGIGGTTDLTLNVPQGVTDFSKPTVMSYSGASLSLSVGQHRVLSAGHLLTDSSHLHGKWTAESLQADTVITTSDRRLKRDIRSLLNTAGTSSQGMPVLGEPMWILRQLRPVSFRYKDRGSEAKQMRSDAPLRFGFIADEVQRVMPDVVRGWHRKEVPINGVAGGADGYKGVVYQDLIALLVAALQTQEQRIKRLEEAVEALSLSRVEVSTK